MLGLLVGRRSCHRHAEVRLAIAHRKFSQFYRLRGLSIPVKMMLYKMVLRPILAYPAIPMNTLTAGRLEKLESFERKVARWVFNIRWDDFVSNARLERCMKENHWTPISLFLHQQAWEAWERFREVMPLRYERFKRKMRPCGPFTPFPSSLYCAMEVQKRLEQGVDFGEYPRIRPLNLPDLPCRSE